MILGICAADVVSIPYPHHLGSSGFLVDAAATGKMILSTDQGWIGESVRNFELGVTCDVSNPKSFAAALVIGHV